MQGSKDATTFNKNYKIYSQSPQFMPTIRKPLDSPYQPLPKAIKPPEKNAFLGGVLNDSPATDTNTSQDFHSAAKGGSLSTKAEADSSRKIANYEHPTFTRTLTEREEEAHFKDDQLIDRKSIKPRNQPNLLFQPQS